MEDFAASMFSSEVAICWPRNSKRDTRPPTVARDSEMRSMERSMTDIAEEAAPALATLVVAVMPNPAAVKVLALARQEELRVWKDGGGTCGSRWSAERTKK